METSGSQETKNLVTQDTIQPFTYTGYQRDSVANSYYAQAREYTPNAGRYTGEDIVKGNVARLYTLNPYAYCWNRPMRFVDLDGKIPIDTSEFIQYQEKFSGSGDRVGLFGNVKDNGCGIVAMGNVGVITGDPDLSYESALKEINEQAAKAAKAAKAGSYNPLNDSTVAGGVLGTNPAVIAKNIEKRGYHVTWQADPSKVSKDADAYIILHAWAQWGKIKAGAHYQAAYYDKNGKLITTNLGKRYNDFEDFRKKEGDVLAMVVLEIYNTGGCL